MLEKYTPQIEDLTPPEIGSAVVVERNPDATHSAKWVEEGWTVESVDGGVVTVTKATVDDILEKRVSLGEFNALQAAKAAASDFDRTQFEVIPPISEEATRDIGGRGLQLVDVAPAPPTGLISAIPEWSQSAAPVEVVTPKAETLAEAQIRLQAEIDAIKEKYDPETQLNLWKTYAYKGQEAAGDAFNALSPAARHDMIEYHDLMIRLSHVLNT